MYWIATSYSSCGSKKGLQLDCPWAIKVFKKKTHPDRMPLTRASSILENLMAKNYFQSSTCLKHTICCQFCEPKLTTYNRLHINVRILRVRILWTIKSHSSFLEIHSTVFDMFNKLNMYPLSTRHTLLRKKIWRSFS